MSYKNKRLQLKQIDDQLRKFKESEIDIPHQGWISTIQKAISMNNSQLAERLGTSHQAVSTLVKREARGTITLNKLKEVGHELGLKLVYGFIPEKSLQHMVEQRAKQLAYDIVMRTSQHMSLEAQKIDDHKLEESINERASEIVRTMPNYLWD